MEPLIGSHVSMSGKDMLLRASREAASYGANTFLIYTGAPHNTLRKPIESLRIREGHEHMREHGISNIVVHAPFIINLGNTITSKVFEHGVEFLRSEIKRTEALGSLQIVLHPGSHVGAGKKAAIRRIIEGLNEVLSEEGSVQVSLETMAGKGSECGSSFEELASILEGVHRNDRLSVCMDTCHIHDAGYDVRHDFDGVLEQFHRIIGIERLKVIHINDSKNVRGSRKDRHENIGHGCIGLEALRYVVNHPQLTDIPKLLETPSIGERKYVNPPYKHEISLLRGEIDEPVAR
ncbi:deoxyribonuclease IV [Paenibacillus agaridevorans]|uniref:Probable endonuclease 4 n=1 Tax=Paenibacillus agaridevorans TaxID=171404 RepID=A0A2R5EHI2_9BACL|nr:deoxyribonuclease IV [Paenibacillus agaridevorans]GBG06030.1 deoxyribonuclease IV [Paenibacillus agaridevorans]